jgi:SAM-dependent methyltransferase
MIKNQQAKAYYASLEKESIVCPITQSANWEPLCVGDRYGMGVETMINAESGYIATNPRPTEYALNQFYQNSYRDYYFSFPDPEGGDYRTSYNYKVCCRRAKWLHEFCSPYLVGSDLKVIDVGCADGLFLSEIKNAHPDFVLYGIEPDPRYGGFAERSTGAQVHIGDLNEIIEAQSDWNGQFDLLVLSHVLEHLCAPNVKLAKMRELLKPDGLILIEVPNIASLCWHGSGMFHIGHINQFYPDTMIKLVENAGFELVDIFHGIHPADPWAMTVLARKKDRIQYSPYRLPIRNQIGSIAKATALRSNLEITLPSLRKKTFIRRLRNKCKSALSRG